MKIQNLQRWLDSRIEELQRGGIVPRLLLHSCCAPCSSYVLEYLSQYFDITVLYYNPNLYPAGEYSRRAAEQRALVSAMPLPRPVRLQVEEYDPRPFYEAVRGMEQLPEGGARCMACYRLRLEHTAQAAKAGGFDYFTTTLSISPHKDAQLLAQAGEEMAARYGVSYLYADFKKRGGFQRSTVLSREYGLYRQDYCGCIYSFRERQAQLKAQAAEGCGEQG